MVRTNLVLALATGLTSASPFPPSPPSVIFKRGQEGSGEFKMENVKLEGWTYTPQLVPLPGSPVPMGMVWINNADRKQISLDPPGLKEAVEKEKKRLEEAWVKKFCDHSFYNNIEDGTKILDHTRVVWEIDDWIARKPDGWSKWPGAYLKENYDPLLGPVTNIGGCATFGGTCDWKVAGWTCEDYYYKNEAHRKRVAEWIFILLSRVNKKLTIMQDKIRLEVQQASLDISRFDADFGGEQEAGTDPIKWISMALTLGGILAPPAAPMLGTTNTVLNSIHQVAAEVAKGKAPPKITANNLNTYLADYMQSTIPHFQRMLDVSMGEKSIEEFTKPKNGKGLPEDVILPRPRGDANLKTAIGKFLNDPLWMLEENANIFQGMLDGMKEIPRKLVDMKMRSQNIVLVADMNHRDPAKCKDDVGGHHWLNYMGKEYCFHMMKREHMPPGDGSSINGHNGEMAHTLGKDHYEKMDRYGFRVNSESFIRKYYEHLLLCHKLHGKKGSLEVKFDGPYTFPPPQQGLADLKNEVERLKKAACFYNVPVYQYVPLSDDKKDCGRNLLGDIKHSGGTCRTFNIKELPRE